MAGYVCKSLPLSSSRNMLNGVLGLSNTPFLSQ